MAFHRTFIHVLPVRNQWEVKADSGKEQDQFFATQGEAEQVAEALAHVALPSELIIHNEEGVILKHASYE